ncbi:type VI secretion system baseplate subunit TssG [Enterovibrio sp. ZSDZ35]|uniref:Type VI secretion system baseplate subunit TssG n=1 Tax=Enterovibrio qingdaonensis TaxID=2899818 RepID=A0ABT5QHP4_9GAMM|nr:type VI secretion system baseplate subunit TssG [Enterovibrio sp. ZSDZ35]MDD1780505.1 type VI secretion system baseplate subunit TssG [Enterovibrio sp. ZSDZ35]
MGHPERGVPAYIAEPHTEEKGSPAQKSGLLDDVKQYNFYQLLELLCDLYESEPESLSWPSEQFHFSSSSSLGFAASDVSGMKYLSEEILNVETTFFGMSGAQSPLPGFFLEDIVTEDAETGMRKIFMDFFNHRLLALLFQAWRKYRYYVRYREDASDRFSTQLFALVGLADENLRGKTPLNWCKMLSYSGLLAGRTRSPQIVSGIIQHYFDLDCVEIRQWCLRHVEIPEEQKCCLGVSNGALGVDTSIGDRIADRSGKFTICIKTLSIERFNEFLPSGTEFLSLITLVEFILREQMAFDLELELVEGDVPAFQLGRDSSQSLGWSSFLGGATGPRNVTIQARQ